MEIQKYHCNGSRGTDCDWCGGSGWKTVPSAVEMQPKIKNKPTENKKQTSHPIKGQTSGKNSVIKTDSKALKDSMNHNPSKKNNENHTKKITETPVVKNKKKSFDQRIRELKQDINETDQNLLKDNKAYLQAKTLKLISEISRLEKRVTKKQQSHFKKNTDDSLKLFENFRRKFKL